MKLILKTLAPLAIFGAGLTSAQTNNIPQVQHVIIVIQENRTPDNLFHEDSALVANGADVIPPNNQGYCYNENQHSRSLVTLKASQLNSCWDPDHSHGPLDDSKGKVISYAAWENTYRNGNMDGACNVRMNVGYCQGSNPSCYNPTTHTGTCPYEYVDNTPIVPNQEGVVQPYFDIANQYGFANYAFQTNQGPSFQAHQFLFSGTSAPVSMDHDPNNCGTGNDQYCHEWFSSELVENKNGYFGCPAVGNNIGNIAEVDPNNGNDFLNIYGNGVPCYNHNTMADLLDNNTINGNTITWKYYPQGPTPGTSLWTAPNAIYNICEPLLGDGNGNYKCNNTEWLTHVDAPPGSTPSKMAPILTDINSCNLPNVSWVIPDGSWSDHAGTSDGNTAPGDYGPSWVAAIVNAVGGSKCTDAINNLTYWHDTVIIVVWDDWGGWYDHVAPWNSSTGGGYSNGTGNSYVYGFRVPMLVISAYNKHTTAQGYNGYISGACGQTGQPSCPNEALGLVHDFGSILNFIEYAFGTGGNFLSYQGSCGIGPCLWPYADYLAPDVFTGNPNCSKSACPYSLSDFFMGTWTNPTTFTPISAPYGPSVFENWTYLDGNTATDPDADDYESQ